MYAIFERFGPALISYIPLCLISAFYGLQFFTRLLYVHARHRSAKINSRIWWIRRRKLASRYETIIVEDMSIAKQSFLVK